MTRARALMATEQRRVYPNEAQWIRLYPAQEHWLRGEIEQSLRVVESFVKMASSVFGNERDELVIRAGCFYLTLGRLTGMPEIVRGCLLVGKGSKEEGILLLRNGIPSIRPWGRSTSFLGSEVLVKELEEGGDLQGALRLLEEIDGTEPVLIQ